MLTLQVFLEVPNQNFPEYHTARVEFIHQTVKEFAVSARGNSIISEDIPSDLRQSGHLMLFRYAMYVLPRGVSHPHFDNHQWSRLEYHGRILEGEEKYCVRSLLEPALIGRTLMMLEGIVSRGHSPLADGIRDSFNRLESMVEGYWQHHRLKISLLFFYAFFGFPLSAHQVLASVKDGLEEIDVYLVVLSALRSRSNVPKETFRNVKTRMLKLKDAKERSDRPDTWFIDLSQEIQDEKWFTTDDDVFHQSSSSALWQYLTELRNVIAMRASTSQARLSEIAESANKNGEQHNG